jgi:hypothetical protein
MGVIQMALGPLCFILLPTSCDSSNMGINKEYVFPLPVGALINPLSPFQTCRQASN